MLGVISHIAIILVSILFELMGPHMVSAIWERSTHGRLFPRENTFVDAEMRKNAETQYRTMFGEVVYFVRIMAYRQLLVVTLLLVLSRRDIAGYVIGTTCVLVLFLGWFLDGLPLRDFEKPVLRISKYNVRPSI